MSRLIDGEKLEEILQGAIILQTDIAKVLGVEEDEGVQMELKAYKDILEGVKGQEAIDAIPIGWIERYADWLTQIPAPFAANDERSIRAMLAKWKTNPDLPKPECSEDACNL